MNEAVEWLESQPIGMMEAWRRRNEDSEDSPTYGSVYTEFFSFKEDHSTGCYFCRWAEWENSLPQ